ncbi:MAG: DUF3179 domain-containing (seleno)protein [Cyclobacteriaceae bacterium]
MKATRFTIRLLFLSATLFFLSECSDETGGFDDVENVENSNGEQCKVTNGWLIAANDVVGGGTGKDGIPSLESPKYVSISEVDFLEENDLAVGVEINGQVKVFPHRILDRHEIVNDHIGDTFFSLTFCPLTGSSVAINREENSSVGVSGLLHNSNLIYYSREDDSFWSQMKLVSVRGNLVCEKPDTRRTLEMTWNSWKKCFPDLEVLSINTGFDRNYTISSFSRAIQKNNVPLWPYSPKDSRLRNYDKVFVLFEGKIPKAYPMERFTSKSSILRDNILGRDIILAGNSETELVAAYYAQGLENYEIKTVNSLPAIVAGSKSWNLFGRALSNGFDDLEVPDSYMAYWFSVGAMFPQIEIFDANGD